MKCPKCKGTNLTASERPSSPSSKYGASRVHHSLAKSGHPIGAAIVGVIQVGVAIHETFNITYTCHGCGHSFNKFQSWNLL
jgi:protein-arginine kinase activator protein McsA